MNKLFILIIGSILLSSCGWWCDDCDSDGGANYYRYVNNTPDTLKIVLLEAYDYSTTQPIKLTPVRILGEFEILAGDSLLTGPNGGDYGGAPFIPFNVDKVDSVYLRFENIKVAESGFYCFRNCNETGNILNRDSYEILNQENNIVIFEYRFGAYFHK